MTLDIKHMVSLRCKMVVGQELLKLGIEYLVIGLGTIEIVKDITPVQRKLLKQNLLMCGLELLDDPKSILIEKIKSVIVDMIHYNSEEPEVNYSSYISKKLNLDYTYLSNLFTKINGFTIQQFIIKHKIERAKELLQYQELTLTEISYKLHYSSVAHLSNQFKKTTGFSPSSYKQLTEKRVCNLENI